MKHTTAIFANVTSLLKWLMKFCSFYWVDLKYLNPSSQSFCDISRVLYFLKTEEIIERLINKDHNHYVSWRFFHYLSSLCCGDRGALVRALVMIINLLVQYLRQLILLSPWAGLHTHLEEQDWDNHSVYDDILWLDIIMSKGRQFLHK